MPLVHRPQQDLPLSRHERPLRRVQLKQTQVLHRSEPRPFLAKPGRVASDDELGSRRCVAFLFVKLF
jgi:hypothetical protein